MHRGKKRRQDYAVRIIPCNSHDPGSSVLLRGTPPPSSLPGENVSVVFLDHMAMLDLFFRVYFSAQLPCLSKALLVDHKEHLQFKGRTPLFGHSEG